MAEEPKAIPILGLENIEEAMQYLRSAEVALTEFEKQTRMHPTLLGRRASFVNRERAEKQSTLFEGYVSKCESVHGSHAWIRLVTYRQCCIPRLDEFMAQSEATITVKNSWFWGYGVGILPTGQKLTFPMINPTGTLPSDGLPAYSVSLPGMWKIR